MNEFIRELIWRDYAYHRMEAWSDDFKPVYKIGDDISWPGKKE